MDIDADALAKALERQRVSAPGIHIHAPIDLSGLCDLPEAWQRLPQPPAAIERQILVADNRPRLDLGPFDVVLSPCVLSQLLYPIRNALGVGHPQLKRLCTAIRHRHLRMILELLKPGGKAILALDLADNDAFPGLPRVGQDQLTDLMKSLLRDRRYFPGLEPACLRPALDNLPARNLAFTSPWLWHLSIRRSFLVYAAIFHHA